MAVSEAKRKILFKIGLYLFIGTFLGVGSYWKYQSDIDKYMDRYRIEQHADASEIAINLQSKLNYVYQTIRTVSYVPGVRKIDRYGKNFDPDAKATVQQLFNNAFLNIQLSEVYILPSSLDPDRIDPVTGKPEEPITTFDEFVPSGFAEAKREKADEPNKIEEVETFEYRLMKSQLEFLAAKFPDTKSFTDIDIPMVSGKDVITCDNAEFTKEDLESHNDEGRKGIVFTVPTYGMNGKFRGAVSAVIRNNVIRKYFPNDDYSLENIEYGYSTNVHKSKAIDEASEYFKKGVSDTKHLYSEVIKLKLKDTATWSVLVAHDDSKFWSRPEISEARKLLVGSICAIFIGVLVLCFLAWKDHKLSMKISTLVYSLTLQTEELSARADALKKSSDDIASSTTEQEDATQQVTVSMDQVSSMTKKNEERSESLESIAKQGLTSANDGKKTLDMVERSIVEVSLNQDKIDKQIQANSENLRRVLAFIDDISNKTQAINDIVFQTKLLSFNASVEAARAGENGKGFSVVAEEVGNLARMSGESAVSILSTLEKGSTEIKEIIKNSTDVFKQVLDQSLTLTKESVGRVESCKQVFNQILDQVSLINQEVANIAAASQEQSIGVSEASKGMHVISGAARKNTENTAQTRSIAVDLLEQAEELQSLVNDLSSSVLSSGAGNISHNKVS